MESYIIALAWHCTRACVMAVTMLLCATSVSALPLDGTVSAGSASIGSDGATTTIAQSSERAVIDWRGFDIAPNELTQFVQPSSQSMTLNRISGNTASRIDGALSANGNIILVNPNGVWFGSNARVDVNGLIASTANISNDGFMNNTGILNFDEAGNPDATIVNDGLITAKDAGLVGLVAPNVINRGIIVARLGRVALASGDTATIDLYGDDLIKVAVSDKVKSQLISNSGLIAADGGTISLTAAAGKDIVNSLITVSGELSAPSIHEHNGKIIIAAEGSNKTAKQGSSTVLVSGILDASGRNAGEHGGTIQVTGDNIALLAGTRIDASGSDGLSGTTFGQAVSAMRIGAAGGDIRIGGDYLGGNYPGGGDTPTALNLYVDQDVLVLNDALNSGDAGRIIFWSDGVTQFYGNVYARALGGKGVDATSWNAVAGGNAGDGGFIETSGHGHLDAGGYVDLTASNGARGTYFLDPTNITIYGIFAPNYATVIQGDATALSANLKLWLDASDTANTNLTYSALTTAGANACASSCLTATGTSGATTITTSANIASTLQVGQRLRLGAAGAVTAASTLGADTYTIASISGTTITFTSALTTNYTTATVYGGYVSQLTDKSGNAANAIQATASKMPLWVSNSQNGLGVVSFNGTSAVLTLPGLPTGPRTIIVAATAQNVGRVFDAFLTGVNPGSVAFQKTFINYYTNTGVGRSFGGTYFSPAMSSLALIMATGSTSAYYNGASTISNSDTVTTICCGNRVSIGARWLGGSSFDSYLQGTVPETLIYNAAISTNAAALISQYLSAKWNYALAPSGSGTAEADKATASIQKGDAVDGYSVFATRYLERLSQSANIALQASNNISLDLQGDTLVLASGKNLSLTAGNAISNASAGTVSTTGGGTISLAAGAGGITLGSTFSINASGALSLTTTGGGAISVAGPITNGSTLTVDAGSATSVLSGVISGAGAVTKNGAGTLTFSGANTYIGLTSVNAGTLSLNGSWNVGAGTATTSIANGATLSGTGIVTAATLRTSGPGTLSLTGNNAVGSLVATGTAGAMTFKDVIALTLGSIASNGALFISTTAGNDITIAPASVLSTSASGSALTLVSGRNFINNAGATALSPPGGRWLVYSANPANDTSGGLNTSFRRFSCTYGASCPSFPAAGNGFLYSLTPTLTAAPSTLASIAYGTDAPALSGYAYTLSGYLGSDASADIVSGSLNGTSSYAPGSSIGTYAINYSLGTLASSLGYAVTYANNSSAITVVPRALDITVDVKSKIYGDADPALTYQITSGSLFGSDFLSGALTRVAGESVAGGPYAIKQGTLGAGSNYTIAYTGNAFAITPALLEILATRQVKNYANTDPELTYSVLGLTNSDDRRMLSGRLQRQSGELVGNYTIGIGTLTANANYRVGFTPATFTIIANQIPPTVTRVSQDPTLNFPDSKGQPSPEQGRQSPIGHAVEDGTRFEMLPHLTIAPALVQMLQLPASFTPLE